MSDLVGKPEDRFSRVAAHIVVAKKIEELRCYAAHTELDLIMISAGILLYVWGFVYSIPTHAGSHIITKQACNILYKYIDNGCKQSYK